MASLVSAATSVPKAAAGSSGPASNRGKLEEDMMYGVNVADCHLKVRLGFVRKVYGIVAVQLACSILMGVIFMKVESIKNFVQHSPTLLYASLFLAFVPLFALFQKRNEYPTNMYLLGAFTICEAYAVGVTVTFYDQMVVLQAAVLTAAVVTGLTLFTFQTKRDFTPMNTSLITFLWVLIGLSFLQMMIPFGEYFDLLTAMAGAVVFSLFIVVDTQMMLKKVSTDEYILCALNLYLDILNLFLKILRILSKDR
eukprot:m.332616 g.332616  ORF g.332616 m.332616 type:complete len:253 (-) comp16970_c0_seq1:184-942(-)